MQSNFIIYRILGNSLPPRHGPEDTYINLRYILENEPHLLQCEKRWILNRITDPKAESDFARLIEDYGQKYHVIPFDAAGYKRTFFDASGMPRELNPFFDHHLKMQPLTLEWVLRFKSLALINLNDARNKAIELGRAEATWILPLDGSCYFTQDAWEQFVQGISSDSKSLYAIIPLVRLNSNDDLMSPDKLANAVEEPQIAFRHDAPDLFDERLRYGHRNKGELLSRLGVPGPWSNWPTAPWDNARPLDPIEPSRFTISGKVYRLASNTKNEAGRYTARFFGVQQITQQLDSLFLQASYTEAKGDEYCSLLNGRSTYPASRIEQLKASAEPILSFPIRKITDKSGVAPSGNKQDYFSCPLRQPGAEYKPVNLGGQTGGLPIAGSEQSLHFDRTALYDCTQRTALLAAAGVVCGEDKYLHGAVSILDAWFINQSTCMHPHGLFAQFQPGPDAVPNFAGLIDFRDLWILPGLSKTLLVNGALSEAQYEAIKHWAANLLEYLNGSEQGSRAFEARNNLGTWMHLLKTSLSLFTGRFADASYLLTTASLRLAAQCDENCMQSEELSSARPLHNSLFNITAWILLANLGRSVGVDIWSYCGLEGQSIANMIRHARINMASLNEYESEPQKYEAWLEALLWLTPEAALDHAELPKPCANFDQNRVEDPENGLPPQWSMFL